MAGKEHLTLIKSTPWGGQDKKGLPADVGGGDNGGMDRLGHLERRVDQIDDRLERIEGDVSAMKTSLASMDAKLDIAGIRASVEKAHTEIYKWIATIVISVIGLSAAVYFGIQRANAPYQAPPQAYYQVAPQQAPAAPPAQ